MHMLVIQSAKETVQRRRRLCRQRRRECRQRSAVSRRASAALNKIRVRGTRCAVRQCAARARFATRRGDGALAHARLSVCQYTAVGRRRFCAAALAAADTTDLSRYRLRVVALDILPMPPPLLPYHAMRWSMRYAAADVFTSLSLDIDAYDDDVSHAADTPPVTPRFFHYI